MPLSLPIEPKANELLARDRLALLIGMVLDQQVTLEKAFSSPYDLVQRLGHEPTAKELADYDTDALIEVFAQRPALHRFPKAMAVRVQDACRLIVDRYDGDVEQLWTGVKDGQELLKRVSELPGFGKQKAQIMVALLGKQYGVQPRGWRAGAGGFGAAPGYQTVAGVFVGDRLG